MWIIVGGGGGKGYVAPPPPPPLQNYLPPPPPRLPTHMNKPEIGSSLSFQSQACFQIESMLKSFSFLSFISAFCIMIEFAVFVDKTDSFDDYYSGAFAITIIAFVLCIVIGIIGLIDWIKK